MIMSGKFSKQDGFKPLIYNTNISVKFLELFSIGHQ